MKQKSHSGAKKRLKRTGTGKLRFEKSCKRHRLAQKSKRQKKLAGKKLLVSKSFERSLGTLIV